MKIVKLSSLSDKQIADCVKILGDGLSAAGVSASFFESAIKSHKSGPSVAATGPDGKVMGVYLLLFNAPIIPKSNDKGVAAKSGLQGYALCVSEDSRGSGVGSTLVEYAENLGASSGCDIFWGLTHKNLNASGFWSNNGRQSESFGAGYFTWKWLK